MSTKENNDINLHKNHRERLRKKFFQNNGDNLEEHEILELLLYFVYTRRNTNDIARRLLQRFGDIYNVFEASPEELKMVEGVGERAANFLILQATVTRKYLLERYCHENKLDINNIYLMPENAGEYITNLFYGYKTEVLMLIALNSKLKIQNVIKIANGTIDRVHFYIRDIVQSVMASKANCVIIAHNHPNGKLDASENDLCFSIELEKALSYMGVTLLDHIIVSEGLYLSMAKEYKIFGKLPKREGEERFVKNSYN